MKVLVAHNYYKERGGEDTVFEKEVELLSTTGHDVRTLKTYNSEIVSLRSKVKALIGTAHNADGISAVRKAIGAFRPDVVHFHNVFPLLSPAVYEACHDAGVAVIQTLHNFRPICLGSLLLRDGHICRTCVNGSSLPGILHRCYRGSLTASAAAARMVSVHRRRGTWSSDVDRYIAPTNFSRDIFIAAGFPAERIKIKPNFLPDPGSPPSDQSRSGVLYVGRLSTEKGIDTLVEACIRLGCRLRIVGSGPELPALQALGGDKVNFLGKLNNAMALDEMRRACVIVVPSICFEQFGMVLIEAFACGTAVITTRLGGQAEIVEDNVTGSLVAPGDPIQLSDRIALLLSNPGMAVRLGAAARRAFVERYTPLVNLQRLEEIYIKAIDEKSASGRDRCSRGILESV